MKVAAKAALALAVFGVFAIVVHSLREVKRCREERDTLSDRIASIRDELDELRSVVDSVSPLMEDRGLEVEADAITTALQAAESEAVAPGLTRRPRKPRRSR